MQALGRRASLLELDVRDHASIQNIAREAEAAFGQIEILVNNAGCNVRKPALEVTWDDWNLILDTNLRGSFFVAQAVARAHGSRAATAASSTSVRSPASPATPALAPTAPAAAASRQLTMSLADDWGKNGITVNCLAPGWFRPSRTE